MEYGKLRLSAFMLLVIILFGTVGYTTVEHMTPFDAFYMTLITISTVGFGEINPLTQVGRFITVIIIVSGISLLTYTLGQVAQIFVEGEIRKLIGRRKLEKQISSLKDHYIVCGYGRIGVVICRELAKANVPFVVIEQEDRKIEQLEQEGYLYLNKDAMTEGALIEAGLELAKGLATAVSTDADNVFITLTAKSLRPDIFILSRAADLKNEKKLIKAGASRVVCPYYMGGNRMAQILKTPTVVDVLDTAMMDSELGLRMEEALIHSTSSLVGKTLVESQLRQDFGVMVIAIKHASGEMVFNPGPDALLATGDIIVVIGKQADMVRLRQRLA